MFSFFRKNKELEAMILKLYNDASNNYKDNAQADFKQLETAFTAFRDAGRLSAKQQEHYGKILEEYREMLKGFSHAEQGRDR